jgi:gluconolactonase
VVAATRGGPNGAALGPDGAIYVCNSGAIDQELGCHLDHGPDAVGRIERIDPATGSVDRLYERCGDITLGAPNDLVFDKAGGMWFTDFGKIRPRSWGKSGLFYCQPDGSSIHVGFSAAVNGRGFGAVSYNGVGLSPDGRTVYVADTRTTRVIGFALAGPGELAPGAGVRGAPDRVLATVPGDLGLDSLAVSASGKLCIGTLWTGGVAVVDPVDGRVEHIAFPDELVTNIAFGGEDMRTAYITLSGGGKLIRTRWPEPGLKLNY